MICKAYSRSYPICQSRATREAFIITPMAQASHRASERVSAVAGYLSFEVQSIDTAQDFGL